MLRWICRHYNHKLFMVMQVMHSLLGQPDPRPDSSPVGTDISRNLKLEVHPGRAVAALSGINSDDRTGHRPVVLVRAEHPHSSLPDAWARSYRDLSQGIHDINIRVNNIDERTQHTHGALTQHIQDTKRYHAQQQANHEATMELLKKQYHDAQAFYQCYGYYPPPGQ